VYPIQIYYRLHWSIRKIAVDVLVNLVTVRDIEQGQYDGFLLLIGTDSMDEAAYILDLITDLKGKYPLLITGSMKVVSVSDILTSIACRSVRI
jgi:hypothetical protein